MASLLVDVNETLSDLSPVATVFGEVAGDGLLADVWFASILRNGFALTAAGDDASFPQLAQGHAEDLLRSHVTAEALDEAVSSVLDSFAAVPPHDDVIPGVHALREAGHRLFTLSNGPRSNAERLLGDAGLLESFDDLLTVEGNSPWKPARAAYRTAVERAHVEPGDAWLVAVHPWDVHGAAGAGLRTAWIDRSGRRYPPHLRQPLIAATGVLDLARHLGPIDTSGSAS
ncbi:haloacid dehalogenase type II [Desertivibrio insolitus]|uniref:haloacid dehalogenase type II n=1 Tax=Herbiconiux sp. SYSU D00978 TaxID=2812562 RepID=UPI001A9570E0|nr:haloacid dehalogenase type II [Herbiconiux sp. SYSU D00978]